MKMNSILRFAFVAAALVIGFAASGPAMARAETVSATLETPLASTTRIITGTTVWACEGDRCTATAERAVNVRACRQLARQVGVISAFGAATTALDDADLSSCNTAARPRN